MIGGGPELEGRAGGGKALSGGLSICGACDLPFLPFLFSACLSFLADAACASCEAGISVGDDSVAREKLDKSACEAAGGAADIGASCSLLEVSCAGEKKKLA